VTAHAAGACDEAGQFRGDPGTQAVRRFGAGRQQAPAGPQGSGGRRVFRTAGREPERPAGQRAGDIDPWPRMQRAKRTSRWDSCAWLSPAAARVEWLGRLATLRGGWPDEQAKMAIPSPATAPRNREPS
jgi:hypothetical protein